MPYLGIHHIRFAVGEPEQFARYLIGQFGFQYYAHHGTNPVLVLRHCDVVIVINKRENGDTGLEMNGNFDDDFLCGSACYPVDTVCDTCFLCNNISEVVERVETSGKGACLMQSKVTDDHGTVSYAVLQSPFSNLQHTLVDLSKYSGEFLPGFELTSTYDRKRHNHISCIDHLAYMVPTGLSDTAIEWYNYVFQFERLFINNDDLEEEGFQISHGTMGMRLKAIHGIELCTGKFDSSESCAPVKLVFGESLRSSSEDQIATFLEHHRGGGIQHIGFRTENILEAVKHFKELGTNFVTPPLQYYNEMAGVEDIKDFNITAEDLMKSGILLESSENPPPNEISLPQETEPWYIMQVFTKNIFKEQTFFLELIQRHKTEGGFGAGNIKALWNGVQAHLAALKQREKVVTA